MAPDKGQAESKSEPDIGLHSDSDDDSGCNYFGEDDPEPDIGLHSESDDDFRSQRKAVLRRLGRKVKSDKGVVTTTQEFKMIFSLFGGNGDERFKLEFLTALGEYETLKQFNSDHLKDLLLQPKDWEVLVKSMEGNCQLEGISLRLNGSPPAGSGRHIGELVKSAGNLKTFTIWGFSYKLELEEERFQQELAAIASSLQGHKHPKLVNFTAGYVSDVTNIAKIISSAPHLSYISLMGSCSMDETTKVVLCAAIKECSDLKRVDLRECSEGILEVLAKVYGQNSDPQVSVLESLSLVQPKSLAGLACLASSNICNLEIKLNVPVSVRANEVFCSLEECKRVGRSLVRHPTLRVFKIQLTFIRNHTNHVKSDTVQLGKEIAELWKASGKSPVLDIRVDIRSSFPQPVLDKDPLFVQNALKDTYLKEITFDGLGISPQVFKSFAELVGANTSVRSLRLVNVQIQGAEMSPTVLKDCWAHLFHRLRENTSIRTLELNNIQGLHDENFRDLMDLLQVNFILQEVELNRTGWERDGKSALVQAALERNAKLAGYFSVLGAAQLSFDGAKAGRIFLCGLPFAGKTQLKVTMMDYLGKTSRSESLIWTTIRETVVRWVPSLRRTEGIEVELFYDKEAMTISIWDCAGQEIFRPLQSILFPKISQACVFLFVFNPLNRGDEKVTGLKENVHDAFADELRSWLRFIVSNTQITGRIRPQVIVVITHKDVFEKGTNSFGQVSVSGFEYIVKDLQREFQDVVELCPECSGQEGKLVYFIDGTLKQDLEPITKLLISSMKDVLNRKSPKVPRVCSDLVSFLLKRPPEVQTKPLWPCKQLYDFCFTNSESLSHIDVTQEERGKVLHAIASYMHDAGAVCMTPRALTEHVGNSVADCRKLAVVDLNWLTQNLLGQLITLGHPTEAMKGASVRRFRQVEVAADGLLNTQQLEDILHCVLSEQKDKELIPMVKELLLELDLCYCLESGVGRTRYFFMPMLLGGELDRVIHRPLSWEVDSPQGSSYFGYRIQCRDPNRTSLSPAFYPRYQIHLRKRMGVTLGVKDDNFTFRRSHVEIRVDGYCIFVETDVSSENHIDVLVQFCRPDSRDRIIDFIRRQIVQDLLAFCASEKGCPGVHLVVAIIRTKCVENLTPKQLRTASQVVLVEDLKDTFKKNLKACVESKVGLETPAFSVRKLNELYQRGCQDSVQMREFLDALEFFCFHHWPMIGTPDASQFGLVDERVCAVDLLSSEEVREIVQAVWKDHNAKKKKLQKGDERDVQLGNELAEVWKASGKSPVLDIRVDIRSSFPQPVLDKDPLFVQNALKDTYLKEITFDGLWISPEVFKSFAELVGANTSVRSLRLVNVKIQGAEMSPTILKDCWAHLFHHLRENTSIRTLELNNIQGLHDENFRDLMDLLQVNFILQEVELNRTGWERDGKSALVQAALERNAKLAGYFSVLGAAQLSFDGAKAGRIFLCGLPFAGKTQLKVTMMDCLGKTSRSESLIWTWIKETVGRWVPSLRRTEGIEVELFYDKEAMTISIWDFAGQQIFRPLQNILFPKISQACVFLFVFNPFDKVDEKIIGLKDNVHDAFADELRSWLRFIVSNTQITGRIRPQVIVVITHKDVRDKGNSSFGQMSVSECENRVKDLQREFQDVVELCPECSGQEGKLVYHIDGTLKQDLEPITKLVISSMKDVLSRKSPKVPRVCSDLVSFLLKRPLEVQTKPLWPCKQLYDFCLTNSESLRHIDVTQEERGKVLHAIASYMHDAGAVCMTPRALMEHVGNSDADCRKLAVVDLNWLTQNLLGQLITLGHPAETMKGASVRRFRQVEIDADGLLNTQQLEDILHRILSEEKDKELIPMVKELLLELDLCYCLESGAGRTRYFFMPMLLGGGSEQVIHRPLSWEVDSPQGSSYFGYRIQCRDPNRTSLSPAFYPRYQIHLRKRMGVTLGVKDDNFMFRRSHVEIRVDGYCIFVETDVSWENHIDVLVQFCRPDSRDRIIDFVRRQIVQDLFAFCASEKGCPGVELVVAIIRTKCVENLTPKQLRTANQVVLVEDLKDTFKKNLKACVESKVGLETPASSVRKLHDLYQRGCQDSLQMEEFFDALEFFCFHPWPRTPDASQFGLVYERVCAVDLLSSVEVREIVQAVWKHHNERPWPQEVAEGKAGPCQQLSGTSMEGRRISDELYEVYVPVTGDTNIELVFIHGLQKAVTQNDVHVSAWTVRNDENNCWLKSWLPKHIPTCRILSVSYDASKVKTSSEGRMDMYSTVENLVMSLVEFGRIGQKCPVILVGHSLGGLVAITVCNKAHWFASLSDRIPYRNFCDNIKGLFFYSTPFSGVKLADLGAPRGVTFWGSEGGEAGDLMENLELFDKRTSRRNYDFAQLKREYSWKTQCVVESCHTMFEVRIWSNLDIYL
ncbi:hypothetical protein R1sor_012142 [Riccia sorocarpa]|uniref:Non-specific serine/threonine protein kinase n=1 Tax=Riccia sorocarpa TaxID=122646 RepID=A0ABD3I747_9MARC